MSIKATEQRRAKQVIKEARNGAATVSYARLGASVYDPAEGVSTAATLATISLPVLFRPLSSRELEGDRQGLLRKDDIRIQLAYLDLGAVPRVGDRVTLADGAVYAVEHVQGDSYEAMYTLLLRRP